MPLARGGVDVSHAEFRFCEFLILIIGLLPDGIAQWQDCMHDWIAFIKILQSRTVRHSPKSPRNILSYNYLILSINNYPRRIIFLLI